MHTIDLAKYSLRTDLIIENKEDKNIKTTTTTKDNIKIKTSISSVSSDKYTTVSINDISDKDVLKKAEIILIEELKKYIEPLNLNNKDSVLIVGIGNSASTPDSLGPKTIKNILVTRHLFKIGDVEDGYQNTSVFTPEVTASTGFETSDLIKTLTKEINAKLLIVIDALASSSIDRVNKTVQITNTGIHPGSGIGNNRKEISSKTLNIPVIAIGVPTVVDAVTIVTDTFKYLEKQFSYKLNETSSKDKLVKEENINYLNHETTLSKEETKEILGEVGMLTESDFKRLIFEVLSPINYNLMVTPTEIDFQIERLALLLGNVINKTLHKNYNSTYKN